MSGIDWELYAWVMRGRQRRRVLAALSKPRLPSELKREAGMSLTNLSKTLRSLEDKGMVECLTPGNKTGRLYGLTEKGQAIREEMVRED
jgi:DNA-binding MarR family transcriptional regulator